MIEKLTDHFVKTANDEAWLTLLKSSNSTIYDTEANHGSFTKRHLELMKEYLEEKARGDHR